MWVQQAVRESVLREGKKNTQKIKESLEGGKKCKEKKMSKKLKKR